MYSNKAIRAKLIVLISCPRFPNRVEAVTVFLLMCFKYMKRPIKLPSLSGVNIPVAFPVYIAIIDCLKLIFSFLEIILTAFICLLNSESLLVSKPFNKVFLQSLIEIKGITLPFK